MAVRTLTAVIHREEDIYVAQCPEVGTISQGYTIEEAINNLKEATDLYLEDFLLPNIGPPMAITLLASEQVLRRDWESPEEDQAWSYLETES